MNSLSFIGLCGVLAIWLAAVLPSLRQTEVALSRATQGVLAKANAQGVYAHVKVRYSGQEATLEGRVATDEDRQQVIALIRKQVRLPAFFGKELNPVTAVHDRLTLDRSLARPAPEISLASMEPAIGVTLLPDICHVHGVVADAAEKALVLRLVGEAYPDVESIDHIETSTSVLPGQDWKASLRLLPKQTANILIVAARSHGVPAVWNGEGDLPDLQTMLGSVFPRPVYANRLWASYDDWKRSRPQTYEGLAPSTGLPITESVLLPALPQKKAWLGWMLTGGSSVQLFGMVPSLQVYISAVDKAKALFPDLKVDATRLAVDATFEAPFDSKPKLSLTPVTQKEGMGLECLGSDPKFYRKTSYNPEAIHDFPQLAYGDDRLSRSIAGFRMDDYADGRLKQEDAFISILADGERIVVAGELPNDTTKTSVMAGVAAAYPKLQILDKTVVTSMARGVSDIKPTMESLPQLEPFGQTVVVARLGRKCRNAVIHDIYYQSGSEESKDRPRALRQIREILKTNPSARFSIVGHTDDKGSVESNQKLSRDRAATFAAYLEAYGIPPMYYTVRGAGPGEPIADNSTEAGKALNRRVDVLLDKPLKHGTLALP